MNTEKDWKDKLGTYFAGRGIYRIDYLNKVLKSWLEEYAAYLNTFHEVSAEYRVEFEYIDGTGVIGCGQLTLESRNDGLFMHQMEFLIKCAFDVNSHLRIKYADDYDLGIILKNDKMDPRHYTEEIIDEPERFEKGYVLQLITNRLSQYIEKVSSAKLGCNSDGGIF
jgi:hypothetical protein